jgi:diguanylate cyclase (GGDEF)-like protein
MLILLYERSRSWFGDRTLIRLGLSGAAILTFDQIGFFAGLHVLTGAPVSILVGGWIAKMVAVAFYAPLVAAYLTWMERPHTRRGYAPRISDIFDTLTYRERYEDLLARTGRDALTGALDRGRLEMQGRRTIEAAALAGRPATLLLIDIDHFKEFNDRFGHAAGDAALKRIARDIMTTVRASDLVFRFGGEEFIVLCDGLSANAGLALGERIRREIASGVDCGSRVTVSVGLATCADDASDYDGLFAAADLRLYQAKAAGRNCVIGERTVSPDSTLRLVVSV